VAINSEVEQKTLARQQEMLGYTQFQCIKIQ